MRRFLSICSGIEAASVAFQPLCWEAVAFAEIEPFPCRVLAHHYPQVPNLGDLTHFREWDAGLLAQADVLCGGTPCQAFSVAGLRGSLDDERGNLTLIFCHLYDHLDDLRTAAGRPPAVCLWENVPGIFSDKQNAFGCFLAALAGEGLPLQPPGGKWTDAGFVSGPRRAVAWRTLDAQYHGLAQRRRRVFVVASADPDFDPAAVLLEFDGVRRDSPPRREAGESTAPTLAARTHGGGGLGTDAEPLTARPYADNLSQEGRLVPEVPEVADTLRSGSNSPKAHGKVNGTDRGTLVPEVANCLTRRMDKGLNTTLDEGQTPIVEVTHALRGEGFDASEDGTGRCTPIVPIAFPERLSGTQCAHAENVAPVLQSVNPTAVAYQAESEGQRAESPDAFAFQPRIARNGRGDMGDKVNALQAQSGQSGKGDAGPCVAYTVHGTREGTQAVATPTDTAGNIREGTGSAVQNSSNTLVAFDTTQITSKTNRRQPKQGDPCHPLAAGAHAPAIAFQERGRKDGRNVETQAELAYSLNAPNGGGRRQELNIAYNIHSANSCAMKGQGTAQAALETDLARAVDTAGFTVQQGGTVALSESPSLPVSQSSATWAVRRLTPEECELLQGFPIGYTLLPDAKGKRKPDDLSDSIDYLVALGFPLEHARRVAATPDGPRYKALGNSWAVPCVRWIARRIEAMMSNPNSLRPV